jgi:hypothetical protein
MDEQYGQGENTEAMHVDQEGVTGTSNDNLEHYGDEIYAEETMDGGYQEEVMEESHTEKPGV